MAHSPPLAPHELYAYEPPISLWALVESYVPEHEWQEVKLILGESLVEQSLELHAEIQTLLEIWRDYRNETENQPMFHRLPEPPDARDRLKQEIKFFVANIREKTGENGRSMSEILSMHNKQVLDYVFENKTARPSTARSSHDGRDTPMVPQTPDRLSMSSTVSDDVDAMQDKLNFLKLDEVVQHLRDTISQEVEWLLTDIEFLQECLENEADYRTQSTVSREPTLSDLREARTKLEKELLSKDNPVPNVLRAPTFAPMKPGNIPNRLGSGKLRVASSPGQTPPSGKVAPLKAAHDISTQVLTFPENAESANRNQADQGLKGTQSRKLSGDGRALKSNNPSSSGDIGLSNTTDLKQRLSHESPSHLTIRTATLPNNATVVAVSSVPSSSSDSKLYSPSPPTSAKPSSGRPGSAQRFRKMVLGCRDDT